MLETHENSSNSVQTSVTEPHDKLFPASDPVEKIVQSLLTSGAQSAVRDGNYQKCVQHERKSIN